MQRYNVHKSSSLIRGAAEVRIQSVESGSQGSARIKVKGQKLAIQYAGGNLQGAGESLHTEVIKTIWQRQRAEPGFKYTG